MNCPKCNEPIDINNKFCRNCGESINNEHIDQFNYNYNYSTSQSAEDDIYVQSYVGENYNQVRNTKFSFPAFLLGATYLLYRKLWGYAILLMIVNTITTFFLPDLENFITLAINLFISLNFSKLYMKKARKDVEKIKNENLDKTTQQLIELCRQKGGTSILAPILAFLGIFMVVVISIFLFTYM